MRKHYAVVHYSGFENLDDGSEDREPLARKWFGYADGLSDARDQWANTYVDASFTGNVAGWSPDKLGTDVLMIFRFPASAWDVFGLVSMWLQKGEPIGCVTQDDRAYQPIPV